jgi:hypothetical protein
MNATLIEHITQAQQQIIENIRQALSERIFDNRYTFHPRRLQEVAGEELLHFKSFIETNDTQAVKEIAQRRMTEGFGLSSVLAVGMTLQKFFFREIGRAQGGLLEAGLTAVSEYMDAYLTGYVKAMETSILAEQEQTRRAYFKTIEKQSFKS